MRPTNSPPARQSWRRSSRTIVVAAACAVGAVVLASGVYSRASSTRASGQTSIYVSPAGSDSNPGTAARPLRTLSAAQQLARSLDTDMSEDTTITLEDGIYRLSAPLSFSAQDSGTNGHVVRWTAAEGATPVVSGAIQVTGWSVSDPIKNIWSASVPPNLNTRQIYVNGTRAVMTAAPPPVGLTQTRKGYRATSDLLSGWRDPSDMEFAYSGTHMCFGGGCPNDGLGRWTWSECPVASIHGQVITMAQPCWNNSTRRRYNFAGHQNLARPDYLVNAFELLNAPGQFYLDRPAHRLYYIPRTGEDMTTADVEAPHLQTLIQGNGRAKAPIHDISFSGIQFAYATWLRPSENQGFSEVQSGLTITGPHGYAREGLCHYVSHGTCPYGAWTKEPGALQFDHDVNISFTNDVFTGLGSAGLNLDDGTQAATVQGCVFTDISGNALELGNMDDPMADGADVTKDNRILDNHIYGAAVEFQGGVAVLAGYMMHTIIAHNQIDDMPYTAISIGWAGWPERRKQPPTRNNSDDNIVSDNLIFNILERESDGGGVYNQGSTGHSFATGETVSGNVIHGVMLWGRGLHSDQGAQYITYRHNVLYDNHYDAGANHVDYAHYTGAFDPLRYLGNYWQQDPTDSSFLHVTQKDNRLIDGPDEAPADIVSKAGIDPGFHSIRDWQPPSPVAPSPPGQPGILSAFQGQAYVTWEPSLFSGSSPVESYTVTASNGASATVSADAYTSLGYAIVSGLSSGQSYQFTVTASNAAGVSAPSPASHSVTVMTSTPPVPGSPHGIYVKTGNGEAAVFWYAADDQGTIRPMLSYRVVASNGDQKTISGPGVIEESSRGGKLVAVFGNLVAGKTYQFSVTESNAAGTGPAAESPSITVH